MDEAVWFDAFFRANMVPLFYVETMADLDKEVDRGKSPEDLVGMLAEKTPSAIYPNVHHSKPLLSELLGYPVPMTGQALVESDDIKQRPDGQVGLHVEEFAEHTALLRWQQHEFRADEWNAAKKWRAGLVTHDPTRLVGVLANILPFGLKISDLSQLKQEVDRFCSGSEPETLTLALEVLRVPLVYRTRAVERWRGQGKPPLDQFLPYTTHVFKVELMFYLGIGRGFISGERASNKVDMAYLYYLPFTDAFVSGDRLHKRVAPLFLSPDQTFVPAEQLKQALAEIDAHYDQLPDDVKALGVMRFAPYPPSALDNVVTELWDKYMRPDWRDASVQMHAAASKPLIPISEDPDLAELTQQLEAATPVEGNQANAASPDYLLFQRRVPATKGRWRMVPEDVSDPQDH